ncbi:hypothetical protein CEUSTIGMA_g4617.t1 [Chlamydomonas eustigma]|uniref:GST N-terminal domain-containing protein n=1 Tax=Chlamydomonas eustigma TaxID=1157962 RepID=A0A250X2Q2_9CHLO|nr:hypothetical protein CEUSTIGMA_g4617.t1 [Chlamydomonas eustigma]|eukprot:GAX77172.1 hypothetical protein CEUSTIGMA_g4617.t1 [Chlamydomonas eustigma]
MRCYGDKPKSFMSKVPGGMLPVIELDGRVVKESNVIMSLLEEKFPEHRPLMPPKGTRERLRAEALMKLERQFFSDWLGWLCNGWDDAGNRRKFESTLTLVSKEMEAVGGGPYFMGQDISLVDITFTPMLERAAASLAYYKGYYMRGQGRWPAIDRWFDAMEQRDTYMGTRSDYYTHCHDLPPQLGGCEMNSDGKAVSAMLDGRDGRSWHLPLPPLNASSVPEPYSRGEHPDRDRLQAAAKLITNREAVIKFGLRGPGQTEPRTVSAPLCDPTAFPAMEYEASMDAALRIAAHALLVGTDAHMVSEHGIKVSTAQNGSNMSGAHPTTPAISGAEYMRDRVCVPRDLPYPAARQFRAHMNWLIDQMKQNGQK